MATPWLFLPCCCFSSPFFPPKQCLVLPSLPHFLFCSLPLDCGLLFGLYIWCLSAHLGNPMQTPATFPRQSWPFGTGVPVLSFSRPLQFIAKMVGKFVRYRKWARQVSPRAVCITRSKRLTKEVKLFSILWDTQLVMDLILQAAPKAWVY